LHFRLRPLHEPDIPEPAFALIFGFDHVVIGECGLDLALGSLQTIPTDTELSHRCRPQMIAKFEHRYCRVSAPDDPNEPQAGLANLLGLDDILLEKRWLTLQKVLSVDDVTARPQRG
jgi:hypothetical protein